MAESVDALVSNTNGCKAVPVRPRLWVHQFKLKVFSRKSKDFFFGCKIVQREFPGVSLCVLTAIGLRFNDN